MDDEEREQLKEELKDAVWSLVDSYISRGLEDNEAWLAVEEAAVNANR